MAAIATKSLSSNPMKKSNPSIDLPSANPENVLSSPIQNTDSNMSMDFFLKNQTPLNDVSIASMELDESGETLDTSGTSQNSPRLPNTDNLLDISVPKITLLGKEQAKKRLHAFSLTRQNLIASPLLKKNMRQSKYLTQPAEERFNENGERIEEKYVLVKKPSRKSVNPTEKAKAVIEEIEEMKKMESAYIESLGQGFINRKNRNSRSRSKSRERSTRRYKDKNMSRSKRYKKNFNRDSNKFKRISDDKFKYPTTWTELKTKGYNLETLHHLKLKMSNNNRDNECTDFRKQLLFQSPSFPLHKMTVKNVNGKERAIPVEYIRCTVKNPKIIYSVRQDMPNDCFARKAVLDYVPRTFREIIKKIINGTTNSHNSDDVSKKYRGWYPKTLLGNVDGNNECRVLENSLGLSFLQNYTDCEDQEKEFERNILDTDRNNLELEFNNYKKETELQEDKGHFQTHQGETKNDKKEERQIRMNEEQQKPDAIIKTNDKKNTNSSQKKQAPAKDSEREERSRSKSCDKKQILMAPEEEKHINWTTTNKREHEKHPIKNVETNSFIETERNTLDEINDVYDYKYDKKESINDRDNTFKLKMEKFEEKKKKSKLEIKLEETRKVKCVAETEFGTPDTDEYYSNWESDIELTSSFEKPLKELHSQSTLLDRSWESDEDSITESSLKYRQTKNMPEKFNYKDNKWFEYRKDESQERYRKPPFRNDRLRNFLFDTSPVQNDSITFHNRIDERRHSRHLQDRLPDSSLEMPLNINTTRKDSMTRSKRDEVFVNNDNFNVRSTPNDSKLYSLYTEDSWERDDYLTIRTEEMRLEQERQLLIEERRKLEIERRKLEELERQRYNFQNDRDDERFKSQRDYGKSKTHSSQKNQISTSRSTEDDDYYSHKKHDSIKQQQVQPENRTPIRKENVEKERSLDVEHKTPRKRKSRWQSVEDLKQEMNAAIEAKENIQRENLDEKQAKEEEEEKKLGGGDLNYIENITDNLDVRPSPQKPIKSPVQKPEVLENEYEKFMQSLDTGEKERQSEKRKHKSPERSLSSVSFEEEESFDAAVSKEAVSEKKRRRLKSNSSSSSSSSTSSNSSDYSTSGSDSSSSSESSESNTSKNKDSKNYKAKIKEEHSEEETEEKVDDVGKFEEKSQSVIKTEDDDKKLLNYKESIKAELPNSRTKLFPPSDRKKTNLNIIDISSSEFALLNEIPLPYSDTKSKKPLPVPSPKISPTTTKIKTEIPDRLLLPIETNDFTSPSKTELNHSDVATNSHTDRESLEFDVSYSYNNENSAQIEHENNSLEPGKIDNMQPFSLINPRKYSAANKADEFQEDDSNSTDDFAEKFVKKDDKESNNKYEEAEKKTDKYRERSEERERRPIRGSSPDYYSRDRRRRSSISPLYVKRRRDYRSPRRYDSARRRNKDESPKRRSRSSPLRSRKDVSPRRRRYDDSPGESTRNSSRSSRDSVVRRYRDSVSPRRRSRSPRRRDRSLSRERSPLWRPRSTDRKIEPIQEMLQKMAAGIEVHQPRDSPLLNSPLHGFKRSIADSTISDEQLLRHNSERYVDSPGYPYSKHSKIDTPSPKRIPLDDRINQALGITVVEQPKPISTTYSTNFEYDQQQYFSQYEQYYEEYGTEQQKCYEHERHREASNLKVVQIGNVLQVVPIEDVPEKPSPSSTVQQNSVSNSNQKILQVGNMLQIVPDPSPGQPEVIAPASAPSTTTTAAATKDSLNAEALIKQKMARRAEKAKRRQERERKRKEKEKKKREREKKKQAKLKLHTEAMIKQALMLDTEEMLEDEENHTLEDGNESQTQIQWPPIPNIIFSGTSKIPGKGILSRGLKTEESNVEVLSSEKQKCVKFSDGIVPGEGTSPSGGEELTSPPPILKKLRKEKRLTKIKLPKKAKNLKKKKKVKVKVIRQQQQHTQEIEDNEEDEDDDDLPPPPPPPGSPPPHIFPARIKLPIINNVHPSVVVSLSNPILESGSSYPPVYRPVTMPHNIPTHHHGPSHLPQQVLAHNVHTHQHPCPPPYHGDFNSTIVLPPPTLLSHVPPPSQPHHGNHHHHHHHQSPHHSHNLH